MAERIRAFDWTATPLGPMTHWPQSLKTIVDLMLGSPGMMSLVWGPDAIHLYNDSFTELLREHRTLALGRSAYETFAQSRDVFESDIAAGMAGRSARLPAQRYPVLRQGRLEEAWFDVDYAPIRDEAGAVAGVLWTLKETTAQHLAEQALRTSEARHRLLLRSWAQAEWETDPDGVVVADSPSWRAYTGQTLDEWLGYGWLDAIHPDDKAYAERQWREAVAARGLVNAEFRLRALGGGWRWTNVRATPVLDAGGTVERWAGMNIDIDARKRAEADLRESEERYRTLFEAMDEAYAVVEVLKDQAGAWTDFRFIEVNPAFVAHTSMPWPVGKTATDLLGTPNPRWTQLYGQALDTDEPIRVEEDEPTLGRIFDLNIFVLDRTRNRVAVLFTDITARKKVEAALRESEAQFRALADTAPALIWRNDANGENLFINAHFLEYTGRPADAIRGAGWHSLVHPDDAEDYLADYLAAVRERRAWQNRCRIARHDGRWRWFENYAQPLFGNDGRYLGHVGVSTDVTAGVEAEAVLRASEERQAFLLMLGDAIRAHSSPNAIIEVAARLIGERLDASRIMFAEFDEVEGVANIFFGWFADGARPFPTVMRLEAYEGPILNDLRAGRTVRIENTHDPALARPDLAAIAELGVAALLSVPLIVAEKLVVNLSVHQHAARRWSDDEVLLVQDVAERLWAELVRARIEASLRTSEERLRQFGEASSDVIWIRDAETLQWNYLTPAFERIYGIDRATALAGDNLTGWLELIVPEDRQNAVEAIERVRAGERVAFEYRVRRPNDGTVHWLRNTDFPMRDATGRVCWIGGVGRDVTEEKASAQRLEVLVNELQHRSRNLLGVVTSMANRTVGRGSSAESFLVRLKALSRAQALLSQGGSDTVAVEALVRAELAAHADNAPGRIVIDGPAVTLTSQQVQNFTLALHELATNAVKYGALRDGTGRLSVTWTLIRTGGGPHLALNWVETGVDVPLDAVTRRGYGRELIEQALAYALGGRTEYVLEAGGVRCRIELPIG